jgi:DNA-binding beta-propeller fold protein YncE
LLLAIVASLAATAVAAVAFRGHFSVGVQSNGEIVVPNGQLLTPAGAHIEVNDRPLGMVLSPDRHTLAVVTGSNFNPRALHLIDVDSQTLKQTISISNSFVGVGFSPAGDRIYVGSQDNFSLFSSIYSPLVSWLGPEDAAAWVTLSSEALTKEPEEFCTTPYGMLFCTA